MSDDITVNVPVPPDTHVVLKRMADERGLGVDRLIMAMINTVLYELSQEVEW